MMWSHVFAYGRDQRGWHEGNALACSELTLRVLAQPLRVRVGNAA